RDGDHEEIGDGDGTGQEALPAPDVRDRARQARFGSDPFLQRRADACGRKFVDSHVATSSRRSLESCSGLLPRFEPACVQLPNCACVDTALFGSRCRSRAAPPEATYSRLPAEDAICTWESAAVTWSIQCVCGRGRPQRGIGMRLSVIGCGYLGAVHAAAMASLGHEVVGVDTDGDKVDRLAAGKAPFFEPGLDELLADAVASGRLRFTTDIAEAAQASLHFLAVGTPPSEGADAADVSFVDAAVAALVPHLKPGDVVAGKSTVPVRTAARRAAQSEATGAVLVWNCESLCERWAVNVTVEPDRIVVGVSGPGADAAVEVMRGVYRSALSRGCPLLVTDWPTAELVKVAANAFLATKISFINAMAEIAEVVGADVTQLADALGHDDRIGRRFLGAGIGFGGGCLPKDIRAFAARAEELGRTESVAFLREVDAINLRRRQRAVDLVVDALGGDLVGRRVAVLGAAFK